MTIAATLQLPQASSAVNLTDATVDFIPLGGDGYTGPQSAYRGNWQLLADASGGAITVRLRFDPQYVGLVNTVMIQGSGMAADVTVDLRLVQSTAFSCGVRPVLDFQPAGSALYDSLTTWTLPVLFINPGIGDVDTPPYLDFTVDNTDTESWRLDFEVFNFNKQVLQEVPLEVLSQFLTRSPSLVGSRAA